MTVHRKDKVGEEIKRELAVLIRDELKDPRVKGLVSVTHVEVSRDIRTATAYVSCMGDEETQSATLAGLKQAAGFLRSSLASRLNVRYTPELNFKFDQSIEVGARINQLLAEQHKQRES
jgi:ribosome-binding factor A